MTTLRTICFGSPLPPSAFAHTDLVCGCRLQLLLLLMPRQHVSAYSALQPAAVTGLSDTPGCLQVPWHLPQQEEQGEDHEAGGQ